MSSKIVAATATLPPKFWRTFVPTDSWDTPRTHPAPSTVLFQTFQPISSTTGLYQTFQPISSTTGLYLTFQPISSTTGLKQTFQPISPVYRVVPNILANILDYRAVPNILANIPHIQGCTKHFSQYPPYTGLYQTFQPISPYKGLYQTFQPISPIYRVVPNILANIPHIQGCKVCIKSLYQKCTAGADRSAWTFDTNFTKHFSQYPPLYRVVPTFQPISHIYRVVPNILANIPHIQGCTKYFSQYP